MTRARSSLSTVWTSLVLAGFCCHSGCDHEPRGGVEVYSTSVDDSEDLTGLRGDLPVNPTVMIAAETMRRELKANSGANFDRVGADYVGAYLAESGAKTLDPLKGQPLRILDATKTEISDLTPLAGMPLETLILIGCPVTDLKPLAGLPISSLDVSQSKVTNLSGVEALSQLREFYLEGTGVSDLGALRAVPVEKLWLAETAVVDLRPLAGKTLTELNLCQTRVADLSPLATSHLRTLWLRDSAITDLAPLSRQKLVSLDFQDTAVADLSPLQEMTSLERLNLAGSKVTDLRPLEKLTLTRLIFSPERITAGIETIRGMSSLREIDTSFDGARPVMGASEFWENYDAGKFKRETPADP